MDYNLENSEQQPSEREILQRRLGEAASRYTQDPDFVDLDRRTLEVYHDGFFNVGQIWKDDEPVTVLLYGSTGFVVPLFHLRKIVESYEENEIDGEESTINFQLWRDEVLDLFYRSQGAKSNPVPVHKPAPKKSYVYLISADDGTYKIGYSKSPEKRTMMLQSVDDRQLKLIQYVETYTPVVTERELHSRFSDKKLKGEWFNLTKEDVDSICRDWGEANV